MDLYSFVATIVTSAGVLALVRKIGEHVLVWKLSRATWQHRRGLWVAALGITVFLRPGR